VSHDKSPIEQALDLAVFGPLGLAMAAKDALPGWVDIGRHRVGHQIEVAKMVGEHATRHGQKVITAALVDLGILPGPPPPSRPPRMTPTVADGAEGDQPPTAAPESTNGRSVVVAVTRPPATGGIGAAVPGSADLAIPGYDSLSASQVVQRLAGLAPPELEAVRTYEAAGRGRRTVLTKISQLQTGRS
jgi:hypothetical protein